MERIVVNGTDAGLVPFARSLSEPGADLSARLAEDAGNAQERALRKALNAIANRIAKDLREIALITNASSTKVAQNSFFLDRIGSAAATEADLIDGVVIRLGEVLDHMRVVVDEAQRALAVVLETANTTAQALTVAHDAVGDLRIERALTELAVDATVSRDQMALIEGIATEQSTMLEGIVSDARSVAAAATSTLRMVADAGDLHIGDLNSQLHAVLGRYRIGTFVDQALEIAEAAAREIEDVLEYGLERGSYDLEDLVAPVYRVLCDAEIPALGRLFDVGSTKEFDPPKFGTRYDALVDESLCEIVDRYADANPILTGMCVLDNNAFHIAYSRAGRAALTGDKEIDRAGNRIKRIFDDRTTMHCARVGLERSAAKRALSGRRPYLVQSYARDTGEIFNDLSVALYVRDVHYGALTLAYHAHVV